MSVMRNILLHLYTKFEVRRPSRSDYLYMDDVRIQPSDLDL